MNNIDIQKIIDKINNSPPTQRHLDTLKIMSEEIGKHMKKKIPLKINTYEDRKRKISIFLKKTELIQLYNKCSIPVRYLFRGIFGNIKNISLNKIDMAIKLLKKTLSK